MRKLAAFLVLVWVGCAAEPVRPPRSDKPEAPVTLKVEQTDQGGGRYEVRVTATAREELRSAQLRLILPAGVTSDEEDKPVAFTATPSGKSLTLVRHLHLGVDGADVVADVRVDDGRSTRNRAQIIRLGKARPTEAPQPTHT